MKNVHFDFADEAYKEVSKTIKKREETIKGIHSTWIEILKDDNTYQKKKGYYVSLEIQDMSLKSQVQLWGRKLENALKSILKKHHYSKMKKVLIVGLGNASYLSDALGPRVIQEIYATKHLIDHSIFSSLAPISAIDPGVTSKTGMETASIIQALVKKENFSFVIVIDSLATMSIQRLYKVIQITDTGIEPGSGVQNHRLPITKKSVGCPVISIGVATVVESAAFLYDMLQKMQIEDVSIQEIRDDLKKDKNNYIMTTKDIDKMIALLAKIISRSLNACFNPELLED